MDKSAAAQPTAKEDEAWDATEETEETARVRMVNFMVDSFCFLVCIRNYTLLSDQDKKICEKNVLAPPIIEAFSQPQDRFVMVPLRTYLMGSIWG